MKKLVIVESPAKSKTIGKILGSEYVVASSVGHIRDLPSHRLGISISEDESRFEPGYEVQDEKKKVVAGLVKSAKECSEIYLASDPDREGEAIAWHLKAVIEGSAKKKDAEKKFFRVKYNEITAAAVRKAFENPGEIDEKLVDAQQARRILDRLVGYKVSPALWRNVRKGLSAGRVQSVGLRLVCEREREVRAFTPTPFWVFDAMLAKKSGEARAFKARLSQIDGKKAEVTDEARAAEIEAALKAGEFGVASVGEQRRSRKPFAPFITSTLQQSASNALGMSPNQAMGVAQKLYEGIDLGAPLGHTGLITYMRTDSFSVSQEARAAAREFITSAYGAEYHQAKERVFKSRDNSQGAHEAIRPTDPALTPESVAHKLSPQELKLYALIWRRFVASQMSDAVSNVRTVKIAASGGAGAPALTLSASCSELVFPGFTKVYDVSEPKDGEGKEGDAPEMQAWLPPLAEGEGLDAKSIAAERKETKPPPRFNEASLVKELEANGVGRPSTYASILSILVTRKYLEKEHRALIPTELGLEVNDFLVKNYADLFDVGFTARMETELDDVEDPDKVLDWQGMLAKFYKSLKTWLEASAAPRADRAAAAAVLEKFGEVTEWAPARKIGKRTYDDKKFVDSIRDTFEESDASITQNQLSALVGILMRCKSQLKDADAFFQSIGAEVPEAAAAPAGGESTRRIFETLDKTGVAENWTDFYQSLRSQAEAGRRLSDKQRHCLDRIFIESRDLIPGFSDELCESLEIKPAALADSAKSASADPGLSEALLAGLAQVSEWKAPVKRGKMVYDDSKFFQSVAAQFAAKKRLSEAQAKALGRMFANYKDQIQGSAEVLDKYGLQAPAAAGRRFSKKKNDAE